MLDKIRSFIYDFLAIFIPKKVKYNVLGSCNKCGKCCQDIRMKNATEKDFKLTQFFIPSYRRFVILGKENDDLIVGCTLQNADGTCSVYEKRPKLCRDYPKKIMNHDAYFEDGCGFYVEPEKKFESYLKNNIDKG